MLTLARFLPAFAAATLLSLASAAQPRGGTPAPRQTAPARQPALALAAVPVRSAGPATAAEAPETVVLRGVVLRADGRPLPGASVFLAGAAKQLVVTDENGAFALPVPAGRPVAVLADYFGLGSTRVSVSPPLTQPLRITLGN